MLRVSLSVLFRILTRYGLRPPSALEPQTSRVALRPEPPRGFPPSSSRPLPVAGSPLCQALVDYSIKVCQAKESGEFRPANTIIDREQNVNMT
ncbi:unnamed protein product [Arctogadus glacialis]